MKIPKVAFTILAIAPFHPKSAVSSTEIISATRETLDDAIAACRAQLWIPQPAEICPEGGININISRMKDMTPDGMIGRTPYLKSLHEAGEFIEQSIVSGRNPEETAKHLKTAWPLIPVDLSLPEQEPRRGTRNAVDDILSMVAVPGLPDAPATRLSGPRAWKMRLDALLADLMRNIFSSENFRKFEAAWRGVGTVVRQGPVQEGGPVRILIAPASRENLPDILDELTPELIPEPPNLVLIDFPFDNTPESLSLIERIAVFADNLLSPAAIWITPAFFHLTSWRNLGKLPYIGTHMEDSAYAKWRNLRKQMESRRLVVTLNRFLARPPYGDDLRPRTVFFREREPLWISPVWALGALVSQSIVKYNWPSHLTDYTGVRLRDLAVVNFEGERVASTEVILPGDRIRQLQETGFMPLAGAMNSDDAFMPRETTASGESVLRELLLSHVIGFMIRCRQNLCGAGENPESDVREALNNFFTEAACEPPADLSITMERTEPGEPVSLRITFTPPRMVLPDSRRVDFTFLW